MEEDEGEGASPDHVFRQQGKAEAEGEIPFRFGGDEADETEELTGQTHLHHGQRRKGSSAATA